MLFMTNRQVHERDLNTDFLLVLLARLLRVAPTLRVTLMSATLDAKLFADYFGHALHSQMPVPTLQISGRAFPVREVFLEDVVKNFNLAGCPEPRRRAQVRRPRSRHNGAPNAERDEDDPELSKQLLQQAARQSRVPALLGPHFEEERLSPHAIAAAVVWICRTDPIGRAEGRSTDGAVLVFLPGTEDIREVQRALEEPPLSYALGHAMVVPLHGSLSIDEQQRAFAAPPKGTRKVVLATNVAESSVTIDDVVYVVNSGKLKEKRHEESSGISSLLTTWASSANNKQRRGRAGRVREGFCVNLFLRSRAQRLRAFQLPEMRRVPLEDLCLTIKRLKLGRVLPVLQEALEPPNIEAVSASIRTLTDMGALDDDENLTALVR